MFKVHNKKYDTYPCMIHNPFSDLYDCDLWNQIYGASNAPIPKKWIPEDTTIITWNNRSESGCFQSQLQASGIDHVILGKGLSWSTNRLKPKTFIEHMYSIKTKYILAADCFDVLIVGDLNKLIDQLQSSQSKMIFNATGVVYPHDKAQRDTERMMCADEPFRYFNSGIFIGESAFVRKMYSLLDLDDENNLSSDQYLLRKLYHAYHPEMKIDSKCEIFQVMFLPLNVCGRPIEDFVELIPYYKVHS